MKSRVTFISGSARAGKSTIAIALGEHVNRTRVTSVDIWEVSNMGEAMDRIRHAPGSEVILVCNGFTPSDVKTSVAREVRHVSVTL